MSNAQGNESGDYETTLERQMAAYDALPPKARKALREARFDWATEPLLKRWQKQRPGYKTDGYVSRQIKQMDDNLAFGLRVLDARLLKSPTRAKKLSTQPETGIAIPKSRGR